MVSLLPVLLSLLLLLMPLRLLLFRCLTLLSLVMLLFLLRLLLVLFYRLLCRPVRWFLLFLPGRSWLLPVGCLAAALACLTGISCINSLLVKDLVYKVLFLEELCPLNFELFCYFPQFGNQHFAQFKNIMHVFKMCRK